MATTKECLRKLKVAAGKNVSEEDLKALMRAVRGRIAIESASTASLDEAHAAAAKNVAEKLRIQGAMQRAAAIRNARVRADAFSDITTNFGNNIYEGREALTVGNNIKAGGARAGIHQDQSSLEQKYRSGFDTDLTRAGLRQEYASGVHNEHIFKARRLLETPGDRAKQLLADLEPNAVKIAQIMNDWSEVMRLDKNKAGAFVGKLEGRGQKQTHDSAKIAKAGEEYWTKRAKELFNLPGTLANTAFDDVDKLIAQFFDDFKTGTHTKALPQGGFTGPGNLAKRLSRSRVIEFKDADAAWEYHQEFGFGSVRDSFEAEIRSSAQAVGLMRRLGTNPEATLKWLDARLEKHVKDNGALKELERFRNRKKKLEQQYMVVDGSINVPENAILARRALMFRRFTDMTRLGGILIAQVGDIANYAGLSRFQGRGFFNGAGEAISGVLTRVQTPERLDLLHSLGVAVDYFTADTSTAGGVSGLGAASNAYRQFFRLGGAEAWTLRLRAMSTQMTSNFLARMSGREWAQLPQELQDVLPRYNIREADWNAIRKGKARDFEGKEFLTLEDTRALDDSIVQSHPLAKTKSLDEVREELTDKLRTFFNDTADQATLKPDARARAFLYRGQQPGTPLGEALRFVGHFKGYPVSYVQRVLGRELYGRGFKGGSFKDAVVNAFKNGNGELAGLAYTLIGSTIAGYVSLTIRDAIRGKTPRNISDPKIAYKTFLAAFAQGGGAGLYGDFLFGNANRFGGGWLETVAGPELGTINEIGRLYQNAIRGDAKAADAFNLALNNTPYLNLFYVRPLLNYLFIYGIQDALSPGYLRRLERRADREQGQEFFDLLAPTNAVHF